MTRREFGKLIASLALPQLAGAIGSAYTLPAIRGWYATLRQPAFAPPNWVFGPVWTFLFVLMGAALFLVWRGEGRGKREARGQAMRLFCLQLAFNVLWSICFFGLQSPGLALVEIFLLWLLIARTVTACYRVSRPAAYLLVPYIAWVSFAAVLNASIWLMNG